MADSETTKRSSGRVSNEESDEDASEAQAQVIGSLRAQVTDLFSQVTQLNGKLVASYDRVSDLEDQLHDTSSSLRNASVTISALELERSHHLAALNTGLLVEKAHVTAELNRLMERATDEAAQRGQAETARHDIEKDLDDLSATLFDQANTMVAEARLNQAKSERKVQDAQQALKIAEDAVKDMQVQMQSLQAAKEAAERDAQDVKPNTAKGKWAERDELRIEDVPRIRFMTMHTPYAEFVAFITHLKGLKASQSTPPTMSTLLSQPFVARLLTEDSEPTVRLDLAPSLNWLSRRSVLTAIHTGMLIVEPWSFSSLVQELQQHPQSTPSTLSCALCGAFIARTPSTTPVTRSNSTNGGSWFKYPLALGTTQNHNAGTPLGEREPPGQVYIFRLASTTTTPSTPPPTLTPAHTSSASMSAIGTSRPPLNTISSSRILSTPTQNLPYPLCTSNYCLLRLRSTCSLWAFVRVGIVERIWEEVDQPSKPQVNGHTQQLPSLSTVTNTGGQPTSGATLSSASEKPPVPPRRRRLWDMASAAVSWGKESGENVKEKGRETDGAKKLFAPPPSHPSVPHPHPESPSSLTNPPIPPPLPKRSTVRAMATADTVVPPDETPVPEAREPVDNANSHIDTVKADTNEPNPSSIPEETNSANPPSPSPSPTSHPISTEPSVPPAEHPSPPSPRNVPLPMTPTNPNPASRMSSPVPRPRSRLSSPASPPPSSRSASPAVSRSRAGSPTPAGIGRVTAPTLGHSPSVSHIRGKTSLSSPLAPARPASPAPATAPGAPPLPRRAAARRAVPPPPPRRPDHKVAEEGEKEDATPSSDPGADCNVEAHVPKTDEAEVPTEAKVDDDRGSPGPGPGPGEANMPQAVSGPASVEAPPERTHDATVDDAEAAVSGLPVNTHERTVSPPASAPESDARRSTDTTGTKRSSSTEGEGFASDATWEDRTWKTLVRLKEDMFWARIGGVRAPQAS